MKNQKANLRRSEVVDVARNIVKSREMVVMVAARIKPRGNARYAWSRAQRGTRRDPST